MSQGLVNDRAGLAESVHDINSTNPDQQLASMASTWPSPTINHSRAEVDAGTGGIACDNRSFLKYQRVYSSNSARPQCQARCSLMSAILIITRVRESWPGVTGADVPCWMVMTVLGRSAKCTSIRLEVGELTSQPISFV